MARLSRTGFSPNECAMLGSAVLMIVVSRFCMKSAQATINGTTMELGRCLCRRGANVTPCPGIWRGAVP